MEKDPRDATAGGQQNGRNGQRAGSAEQERIQPGEMAVGEFAALLLQPRLAHVGEVDEVGGHIFRF